MDKNIRKLELLAPARDADTAIVAIEHGADAVYIGAPAFGARAAATNSIDDIRRVAERAHVFGARVYVTLNTIIYENELPDVRRMVRELWQAGVDALIVQDMSLLDMDIPPVELHASTQTDARDAAKISLLARAGFSQIVVPREFSLDMIREAAEAASPASVEVFVHGALCVSYSGDCQAGAVLAGRSANRGECPQICRLQFRLTDAAGHDITGLPDGGPAVRHWLSMADMNRLASLGALVDAGATSFKIEGRLKSAGYVKNVTAAYSRALDEIVAASGGTLGRASFGKVEYGFTPDVGKSFNRGFTSYFLTSDSSTGITSWRTPKWVGRAVATVESVGKSSVKARMNERINNGDGLVFFDKNGSFKGFRVNRTEGDMIFAAPGSELPSTRGTVLYRNNDTAWEAAIGRSDTARRTIGLDMTLRTVPDGRVVLDISDERGCMVSVATREAFSDTARTPQQEPRRSVLGRLGDTPYRLCSLDDRLGDLFLPSKALAALRREAIDRLESSWRIRYERRLRRKSSLSADALAGMKTSYHDNVANSAAAGFYKSHGAEVAENAVEVSRPSGPLRVMTTRYCIRRELGACLKTPAGASLPRELYLDAPAGRLRLEFDCKNCNMNVIYNN